MKRLLPLYLAIFNGFVGYSLMIAVFTPLFIHGHGQLAPTQWSLGKRSVVLGIVLSLYPLGQFFGSPILGALSDRFGRRAPLNISIALCVLGYVFIAYAVGGQVLWLLMAALFITGIIEANIAIAQSAIADVTTEEDRGRRFGYIYVAVSLAYVIGPLVGGKLTDPSIVSWFGPAVPFWATAILIMCSLLYTCVVFKETLPGDKRLRGTLSKSMMNIASIFTDCGIRRIYLSNFLLYLAIFGFFRCFPMFIVDKFGLGISTESEFIAWIAVPIILMNVFVNAVVFKHLSYRMAAVIGGLLMCGFMVIVVLPSEQWMLWITLFLVAAPLALCMTAIAALISSVVGADRQGRVMGNNQAIQVGAEGLSGILGGLIAAIAIWLPLIVLAGIALLGVALLLYRKPAEPVVHGAPSS